MFVSPYLMPHPPAPPLPSSILGTPFIQSVPPPPPVVYETLPTVPMSNQKGDEEMTMVGYLAEVFTKNSVTN